MTTTDTRAALDAEISLLRKAAYGAGGMGGVRDTIARLDRAITAHVEAEVTRRLAVAPSVDDALAAYGTAVYELGYVLHRPDRDAVLRPVKDAAESTLRAAIAADRERAVEGMRPVLSQADAERLVNDADPTRVMGISVADCLAKVDAARTALLRALVEA